MIFNIQSVAFIALFALLPTALSSSLLPRTDNNATACSPPTWGACPHLGSGSPLTYVNGVGPPAPSYPGTDGTFQCWYKLISNNYDVFCTYDSTNLVNVFHWVCDRT